MFLKNLESYGSQVQGLGSPEAFKTTYHYDSSGNITNLYRRDASGALYHEMVYNYHNVDEGYLKNTNKLRWVDYNEATESVYEGDVEHQDRDNYSHEEIGNLINDVIEQIPLARFCKACFLGQGFVIR